MPPCKVLINDGLQLGAQVVAVEPALKKNIRAVVHEVPEEVDHGQDDQDDDDDDNEGDLSPSVSDFSLSLSTTRPTVFSSRWGEWGILRVRREPGVKL